MAILNKFVTSFSELYLGGPVDNSNSVGGIDSADVVTWFTLPSSSTAVSSGGTVAANAVVHIPGNTFTHVYFKNNTSSTITLSSDVTVAGILASGLDLEYAKIPLIAEIGSISNESTVIDVPEFGERFKGKLRGQLDGGQMDTTIYWAPREVNHVLVRELAQTGKAIGAGIKWKPDDISTASELVVFNSFVSSFGIDTAFDDVAKANTTLVVDGSESFGSTV
jgi:hypothetical protein